MLVLLTQWMNVRGWAGIRKMRRGRDAWRDALTPQDKFRIGGKEYLAAGTRRDLNAAWVRIWSWRRYLLMSWRGDLPPSEERQNGRVFIPAENGLDIPPGCFLVPLRGRRNGACHLFDGDLAIVNPHTWLVVGDCLVQHRTQTAKRTASFDAGPGGMMIVANSCAGGVPDRIQPAVG